MYLFRNDESNKNRCVPTFCVIQRLSDISFVHVTNHSYVLKTKIGANGFKYFQNKLIYLDLPLYLKFLDCRSLCRHGTVVE